MLIFSDNSYILLPWICVSEIVLYRIYGGEKISGRQFYLSLSVEKHTVGALVDTKRLLLIVHDAHESWLENFVSQTKSVSNATTTRLWNFSIRDYFG